MNVENVSFISCSNKINNVLVRLVVFVIANQFVLAFYSLELNYFMFYLRRRIFHIS